MESQHSDGEGRKTRPLRGQEGTAELLGRSRAGVMEVKGVGAEEGGKKRERESTPVDAHNFLL